MAETRIEADAEAIRFKRAHARVMTDGQEQGLLEQMELYNTQILLLR